MLDICMYDWGIYVHVWVSACIFGSCVCVWFFSKNCGCRVYTSCRLKNKTTTDLQQQDVNILVLRLSAQEAFKSIANNTKAKQTNKIKHTTTTKKNKDGLLLQAGQQQLNSIIMVFYFKLIDSSLIYSIYHCGVLLKQIDSSCNNIITLFYFK